MMDIIDRIDEYATDTSPILCDGSDFIGPIRPPTTPERQVTGFVIEWLDEARYLAREFMHRMQQMAEQFQLVLTFASEGSRLLSPVAPQCLRPVIEFGPKNWHYELLRIPPYWQFPISYGAWFASPLRIAVRNAWPELTTPSFPIPPRPGYDFSAWATSDDDQHGPHHQHGWNAITPHRRPVTTTRRRDGRRNRG